MPNLYGRQEDEEDEDTALPRGGGWEKGLASDGNVTQDPTGQHTSFTNLEDIFNLNQNKSKEMADAATGQVKAAAGGLTGSTLAPGVGNQQVKLTPQNTSLSGNRGSYTNGGVLNGKQSKPPKQSASAPQPTGTLAERQAAVTGPPAQQGEQAYGTTAMAPAEQIAPPPTESDEKGLTSTETRFGTVTDPSNDGTDPRAGTVSVGVGERPDAMTQAPPSRTALDAAMAEWNQYQTGADEANAAVTAQEAADKAARAQEAQDLAAYGKTDDLLDSYNNDQGQELLKNKYGEGVTAYDAALMGLGGGVDAFADLNKQFQDYDQRYMQEVAGDQGKRAMELQNARGQARARGAEAKAARGLLDTEQANFDSLEPRLNGGAPGNQIPGGGTDAELDAEVAGYSAGKTQLSATGSKLVETLSHLSPEKWFQGDAVFPQRDQGAEIAAQYGFEGEEGQKAFADFFASQSPEVQAWIMGLTSTAGSEVGQFIGNLFGGWGDALHEFTTGTNSTPEEWAAYQKLVHRFMKARREGDDENAATRDLRHATGADRAPAPTPAQQAAVGQKTGRY